MSRNVGEQIGCGDQLPAVLATDNLDFPLAAEPVLPFIDLDTSTNTGNQVFPWIPHTPLFDSGKPPQRLVQNDGFSVGVAMPQLPRTPRAPVSRMMRGAPEETKVSENISIGRRCARSACASSYPITCSITRRTSV